jgi:hypothetical protein
MSDSLLPKPCELSNFRHPRKTSPGWGVYKQAARLVYWAGLRQAERKRPLV